MIDIAAIKEKITCKQFVEHIGLSVNRAGFCCCPLHGEKTASMKLYDDARRGWYCFGCHQGGDVITLASKYYGLKFTDTLKQLSNEFSLGVYNSNISTSDALRIAVSNATRKAIMEKERTEREAAEARYWNVFDAWLANERIIEAEQSKSRDDGFTDRFADSLKAREQLEFALDLAEMERNKR